MIQKREPLALRRLFARGAIVVRLLAHRAKPRPGEVEFALGHCHHGRYRRSHAARKVRL